MLSLLMCEFWVLLGQCDLEPKGVPQIVHLWEWERQTTWKVFHVYCVPQTKCNGVPLYSREEIFTTEQNKTHLRGQCVVYEDVWPGGVRSEGPDRPGSQQIPVVLCLEKLSQLLPAVRTHKSHWLKVDLHIMSARTLGRLVDRGAEGLMEVEAWSEGLV